MPEDTLLGMLRALGTVFIPWGVVCWPHSHHKNIITTSVLTGLSVRTAKKSPAIGLITTASFISHLTSVIRPEGTAPGGRVGKQFNSNWRYLVSQSGRFNTKGLNEIQKGTFVAGSFIYAIINFKIDT